MLKKQYITADALSRRPRHSDNIKFNEEKDIDDWILSELKAYEIYLIRLKSD
jgi:hypothetical protein